MLEALWLNRGLLILAALFAMFVVAMWRGGGPERATALAFMASFLLDRAYHFLASGGASVWVASDYATVQQAHLAIDCLVALVLVAIALRANRIYPIWIAGIQIVALTSYFSRSVIPDLHPAAYAALERGPSYLQIAGFALGLVAHLRRRKTGRRFRSWRT